MDYQQVTDCKLQQAFTRFPCGVLFIAVIEVSEETMVVIVFLVTCLTF